jgi:hypothetical protein
MKLYELYTDSPNGWNIRRTLKLEDDGQFSYEEAWTDYTSAALYSGAEGRWRRGDGAVTFETERVEGTAPHPWAVGRELRGVERGDTLDFGDGYTLSRPPDREETFPVHNTGPAPLTVVLEPRGARHVLTSGERARVVARGPGGSGRLEVVRGRDEIVVHGWDGSQLTFIREPKPPKSAATTGRDLIAEAEGDQPKPAKAVVANHTPPTAPPEPSAKPPVATPAPTRAAEPAYPRFNPLTPSPALAALIRRWAEELPDSDGPGWLKRLCARHGAVPLHSTQFDLWILCPDGQVLCIDHDSVAQRAEPETDPETAHAVLARAALTHPEFAELLANAPHGFRRCELCDGTGLTKAPPPSDDAHACPRCSGMGWHVPHAPH